MYTHGHTQTYIQIHFHVHTPSTFACTCGQHRCSNRPCIRTRMRTLDVFLSTYIACWCMYIHTRTHLPSYLYECSTHHRIHAFTDMHTYESAPFTYIHTVYIHIHAYESAPFTYIHIVYIHTHLQFHRVYPRHQQNMRVCHHRCMRALETRGRSLLMKLPSTILRKTAGSP